MVTWRIRARMRSSFRKMGICRYTGRKFNLLLVVLLLLVPTYSTWASSVDWWVTRFQVENRPVCVGNVGENSEGVVVSYVRGTKHTLFSANSCPDVAVFRRNLQACCFDCVPRAACLEWESKFVCGEKKDDVLVEEIGEIENPNVELYRLVVQSDREGVRVLIIIQVFIYSLWIRFQSSNP